MYVYYRFIILVLLAQALKGNWILNMSVNNIDFYRNVTLLRYLCM